jgi:iron(III) transport system substrate-binding protein
MKKLMLLLLAVVCSMSLLFAAGGKESASTAKNLVVYTPLSDDFLYPIVDRFEAQTGIKVEVIAGGTGELMTRIEAESGNPLGDVMLSGTISSVQDKRYLFETYVSPNDVYVRDGMKNVEGMMTRFNESPSVLIVNKSLEKQLGVEVNGYMDLLNPKLKGKISTANLLNSSSAWGHVINLLYATGNGNPEAGWVYLERLLENLGGKWASGSSAVVRNVVEGEDVVGLTYEEPAVNYFLAGADVRVVYMEEGAIFRGDGVYIIKNAKNMENAKLFIDFCLSEEIQNLINLELYRRAVRIDAKFSDDLVATSDIKVITDDEAYVAAHKDEWIEKLKKLIVTYSL